MTDAQKTRYRCPECSRDIINRAVESRLYCGALIPRELQFTESQKIENEEKYQEQIKLEEERRRRLKTTGKADGQGITFGGGGDFGNFGDDF